MDREAVTKQLKDLKAKAKAARAEGKKDAAAGFHHGAKRLQRRLAADAPIFRRAKKKGGED